MAPMITIRFLAVLFVALFAVSCSDSGPSEATRSGSSALDVPGLLPVPWSESGAVWDGNSVDLIVADAWAGCSFVNSNTMVEATSFKDLYLARLLQTIQATQPSARPPCVVLPQGKVWSSMGPLEKWYYQRLSKECNRDPSTGAAIAATIQQNTIAARITLNTYPQSVRFRPARAYAEADLRMPSVDLCVALRLRRIAPGAMGAEALLLSATEQRQLLAVTKDRAQASMLQLAQLAVVFSAPEAVVSSTLVGDQRIPVLQWWSRQAGNADVLKNMMRDLGAAVQLHIAVSGELAELLSRSGSARLARGGDAQNQAEETWGPGSFRQRMMASLYGGDPLVQPDDPTSPWKHYAGKTTPGAGWEGSLLAPMDWPPETEVPFVSTDVRSPKPSFFIGLAREADALLLDTADDDATTCSRVVVEDTRRRMYRAVEAHLRTIGCVELVPGPGGMECKAFGVDDILDAAIANFAEFEVWKRYRISPDDATAAVELLADFVDPICGGGGGSVRPGAMLLEGEIGKDDPNDPFSWVRISKDSTFRAPLWLERVTAFTQLAPWRMIDPGDVVPLAPASHQGFGRIDTSGHATPMDEAKRVLGSVAALAAAHGALVSVQYRLGLASHPGLGRAVENVKQVVAVIEGAIGPGNAAIRPPVVPSGNDVAVWLDTDGKTRREVDVVVAETDAFWQVCKVGPDPCPPAPAFHVAAISNDAWAGRLASAPESKAFGRQISSIQPPPLPLWTPFVKTPDPSSPPADWINLERQRWHASVPIPASVGTAFVTFVVMKTVPGTTTPAEYRLLATSMLTHPTVVWEGQYLAAGGTLGLMAMRSVAMRDDNPSKPAYDGFGLLTNWVPPTDPALFGGWSGESGVGHYLTRARAAADEATAAVSSAMQSLLDQQTDEAVAAEANAMASKLAEIEMRSVCGDKVPSCTIDFTGWTPQTAVPSPGECQGTLSAGEILDCHVYEMVAPLQAEFALAKPVSDRLSEPAAPAFDEYAGGSLQSAFIEQWSAVMLVEAAIADLSHAVAVAKAEGNVVAARLAGYQKDVELNCGPEAMANAARAGSSTSESTSHSRSEGGGVSAGFPSGVSVSKSSSETNTTSKGTSYSEGPLIAQQLKCDELKAQFGELLADSIARQEASMGAVASYASQLVNAAATLRQSAATIDRLVQSARLAGERAQLEANLITAGDTTSFGLYRMYHSYDLWRAKALLESARRYAVAARRAVEARYVVDLSAMRSAEPFVAAPSSWADEVYTYDLSMPAAVGLAVGGQNQDGVYPNKLSDYVGNLERFVEGFAIERPTATSLEDREVLTLPGILVMSCAETDDGCTNGSKPVDGASQAWSFYCAADKTWVPLPASGDPEYACANEDRPTQARITFSLDPWGRLGMDIAHEPFAMRYNTRWTRFAVSLAGTGVRDCSKSDDALTCYSQPFVRYNLAHVGPSWVTGHDDQWRVLGVPTGRVEGAKALAAEMWLDPIADSFAKPEIDAATRGELFERPLGGTYEMVLEVPPELVLAKIEKVQILLGSQYWVKQQ